MFRSCIPSFLWLLCALPLLSAQEKHVPTFEEVLSLKSVGTPVCSPNGQHIAYTVRRTDWTENGYDTEIWLRRAGEQPFSLTNTTNGSSTNPKWSPDGQWVSFIAKRGEKSQIHAIRITGGEAIPLTHEDEDINEYAWSPDGTRIAFTRPMGDEAQEKKRKERFGDYEVDDADFKLNWLYVIEVDPDHPAPSSLPCYDTEDSTAQAWDCIEWPKAEALLDSVPFTIRDFAWSPNGKHIALTHTPDPLINSFFQADISILEVTTGKYRLLVQNASYDNFADWSPDGQQILYSSDVTDTTSNYYTNGRYFRIPIGGGAPRELATNFDENLNGLRWTERGIFATAVQKTQAHLFRMDPESGVVSPALTDPQLIFSFTVTDDGRRFALRADRGNDLPEVYAWSPGTSPQRISRMTAQITHWRVAESEVISWQSRDGTEIEGILHKPDDYDPNKKYPLLVVIHGGPTGVDRPTPILSYVYPVNQWLYKDALVLRVNYRGSAGYGEAFRSLNVRNLGVGDAWDVLSGVDYLAEQDIIDTTKMGCMGWSQGGYISAFLTTNTDRFRAISVGAGISNWMTYYVNTDIHPFTRQYLQATPWEDEGIYRKTSPMTNITQATTPTLIQHGEFDRRVPIANAYELLQGLRDQNVPAQLVVYKGFGHGITKPKERLAAMWHNWQWFNKYVWGEEIKLPFEE